MTSKDTSDGQDAHGIQVNRLGDYVFGRKCGQGQFGKVVVATHAPSGRVVAIKCVEKTNMKPEAWRLVQREAYIMKIMHHPNIIRFVPYFAHLSFGFSFAFSSLLCFLCHF